MIWPHPAVPTPSLIARSCRPLWSRVLVAPNAGILFDDLDARKSYDPMIRYGHSKLANALFARVRQACNPA